MTIQAILLPLFVQVALTFVLLFWAGFGRINAVLSGAVRSEDTSPRGNWPARTAQASNAYRSQLQVPVLFYVLVILAAQTRQADLLFVILSWVFVALRIAHALVHVTNSHLGQRARLFLAGAVVLAVMWAIFAARILLAL
jgi:hypothetical protein